MAQETCWVLFSHSGSSLGHQGLEFKSGNGWHSKDFVLRLKVPESNLTHGEGNPGQTLGERELQVETSREENGKLWRIAG
jgi:hypothetical protein